MPVLLAIILGLLLLIGFSLLPAALLYIAWNYGILAAFPTVGLGYISFWQAFALGIAISIIGAAFRRSKK